MPYARSVCTTLNFQIEPSTDNIYVLDNVRYSVGIVIYIYIFTIVVLTYYIQITLAFDLFLIVLSLSGHQDFTRKIERGLLTVLSYVELAVYRIDTTKYACGLDSGNFIYYRILFEAKPSFLPCTN